MHTICTTVLDGHGVVLLAVAETRDGSRTCTVTAAGELDQLGDGVLDGVVARLRLAAAAEVVVDLCDVGYLNGHGLAVMLRVAQLSRVRGTPLVLRCRPGQVARLLHLVGLGDVLQTVPHAVVPGSRPSVRATRSPSGSGTALPAPPGPG